MTPSVTTIEIVAPGVPVPLAVAFSTLPRLSGSVTVVMATVGATVSLVAVVAFDPPLPAASVAVAVKVSMPSASALTLMPVIVQVPLAATVAV